MGERKLKASNCAFAILALDMVVFIHGRFADLKGMSTELKFQIMAIKGQVLRSFSAHCLCLLFI